MIFAQFSQILDLNPLSTTQRIHFTSQHCTNLEAEHRFPFDAISKIRYERAHHTIFLFHGHRRSDRQDRQNYNRLHFRRTLCVTASQLLEMSLRSHLYFLCPHYQNFHMSRFAVRVWVSKNS